MYGQKQPCIDLLHIALQVIHDQLHGLGDMSNLKQVFTKCQENGLKGRQKKKKGVAYESLTEVGPTVIAEQAHSKKI